MPQVNSAVAKIQGRLDDLKALLHLLPAPAIDGHGLISQAHLSLHHRVMAQMHWNILRFWCRAKFVDDVETLH